MHCICRRRDLRCRRKATEILLAKGRVDPADAHDGSVAMGRLSFTLLLTSQLLATTAFMFVVPFMPLYVQQLGVQDAGHAAA